MFVTICTDTRSGCKQVRYRSSRVWQSGSSFSNTAGLVKPFSGFIAKKKPPGDRRGVGWSVSLFITIANPQTVNRKIPQRFPGTPIEDIDSQRGTAPGRLVGDLFDAYLPSWTVLAYRLP